MSWRAHSRSYDVGKLRAVLRRQKLCSGVANSLVGSLVSQQAATNIFRKTMRS